MLETILGKLSSSILAIVGNLLVKDENGGKLIYQEFSSMMFFTATVVSIPLFFAINAFINIWYEGKIATSMLLAFAFAINLFVYLIKQPTVIFCQANGLFKETKKWAITDTIVNLILSFVLLKYLGIAGIVIATAISVFIAEYHYKLIVLCRTVLKEKAWSILKRNIIFFVIAVIDLIVSYFILKQFNINSLLSWFIIYMLYTLVNAVIIIFIYKLFGKSDFIKRFIKVFKRN